MKPKLVLCEGKDDKAVVEGLLVHLKIESQVSVESIDSRDNLGNYLRALTQKPEFVRQEVESLGIILDADDDSGGNWRRIVEHVRNAFKVVLLAPASKVGNKPGIAGILVPADGRPGMLETVCLETVRSEREYGCFEEYVSCVERVAGRELHPKAKFRAWMASQPTYDFLIREAAWKNLLPWDHEAFESLRVFLRLL